MAKQWDYQTWRDEMREEARQEGRQEGLQEGRQEGLQEGRQEVRQEGAVRAKQHDILMVVQARFANVPEELRRRIESIAAPAELDALLIRVATASTLDDVRAALPH